MIVFPNCKINLGLNILRKREDGFHDLETVFYPVQIKDMVEVIAATTPPGIGGADVNISENLVEYSQSGIPVNGSLENNLCIKAYHLLKKDFPFLSAIKMHLHKTIPMGAGLGGGSADAAFTLRLLNDKFFLNLSEQQLISYALQLGSDCPFFIINSPCLASGRGEEMERIELDLSAYHIALINPGIHVNTGFAFAGITPAIPQKPVSTIIQQPISTWKNELVNDFENPIFEKFPEIKEIKASLYHQGAVYASMSGSGSSVFGIFEKTDFSFENLPSHYYYRYLPMKGG